MDKLSELYEQIDQLNHDELMQVSAYLDQRLMQSQISDEDVQTKIAVLLEAVKDFWGDMPQEEIDAIVEGMNSEYIEPVSNDWVEQAEGN